MDKSLGLLGIARKGGKLELGEEDVGSACRAGHARLLILASDAGASVSHRAEYFVRGGRPPIIHAPFTKDDLGAMVGRNVCPIAALTDVALAKAFVEALAQPEQYAALLADLEVRVKRVEKRRQEEKAHQRNLHRGRK